MLPDGVSNPGPLTYESGALSIALCGRHFLLEKNVKLLHCCKSFSYVFFFSKKILAHLFLCVQEVLKIIDCLLGEGNNALNCWTGLQKRGNNNDDNSKIIFLISKRKHIL